MRTLAITRNVTVDGAVEVLDDWFDGPRQADQSDLTEEMGRQMAAADAFLTGRVTFEDMRGFWPAQTDDATGVAEYLNRVAKYVVSSTLTDPGWAGTTVLTGDPVEAVGALKEQPGRDIVVTGSISLCHTLIAAGLVDEYRLLTYPVVQGRGRRLFVDGAGTGSSTLREARAFRGGVVLTRYAAA